MPSNPLVSVVIPTYNRAELICPTIENVFQQTYKNLEVIIVDDGSKDETLDRLSVFGDRIRVISQANAGPGVARNRGVDAASGEIIAFQDSDDIWMPTKLEQQVSLLQKAGADVPCCLCNAEMHFADKSISTSFELAWLRPNIASGVWTNVPEVLATTFVLFNQCSAIRSDVLRKVGGFDESYRYMMEDYDLSLRLSLEGRSWAFIREPLVVWRQGSDQSLSLQAKADEIRLKECELKIRGVVSDRVRGVTGYRELEKNLSRERKRNQRELAIAKIRRRDFPGVQSLAWLLQRTERYRNAVHRRTPSFPRMQVRSLGEELAPVSPTLRSK